MRFTIKLLKYPVIFSLGVMIGFFSFGLHSVAVNSGMKDLKCRIVSQQDDGPDKQTISLAMTSPKDGFAAVFEIDRDKAKVIWQPGVDRPVWHGQNFVIDNCQAGRQTIVFVAVTQTPVCLDVEQVFSQSLAADARSTASFPDGNATPPILLLFDVLAKFGHNWAAIGRVQ